MIYSFGDYELDLQRYELRCAGRPVKIEPQVFNLLAYFIHHRDRLITKEELLDQLWPGRIVGEATLTSRVRAARKAIGDAGRVQRLIQTLHGRGYRFIAPIAEHPDGSPNLREPPRSTRLPSPTDPDEGRMEAPPASLIALVARRAVGREAE
jgi:DNA-binding winged helix-turn-helix (wHTH) protein